MKNRLFLFIQHQSLTRLSPIKKLIHTRLKPLKCKCVIFIYETISSTWWVQKNVKWAANKCIQNLSLIYDQNAIVNCPIKLIIIHWMMLLLIVRHKSDNWVIRYVLKENCVSRDFSHIFAHLTRWRMIICDIIDY